MISLGFRAVPLWRAVPIPALRACDREPVDSLDGVRTDSALLATLSEMASIGSANVCSTPLLAHATAIARVEWVRPNTTV